MLLHEERTAELRVESRPSLWNAMRLRLVLRIQPRSGAAIVSAEPGALGAELLCFRLIKVNQATGLAVRRARGGAGSFFR